MAADWGSDILALAVYIYNTWWVF